MCGNAVSNICSEPIDENKEGYDEYNTCKNKIEVVDLGDSDMVMVEVKRNEYAADSKTGNKIIKLKIKKVDSKRVNILNLLPAPYLDMNVQSKKCSTLVKRKYNTREFGALRETMSSPLLKRNCENKNELNKGKMNEGRGDVEIETMCVHVRKAVSKEQEL